MKKLVLSVATAAALSMTAGIAQAGGWGGGGWGHSSHTNNYNNQRGNFGSSSGLVNVSPSVGLGDVGLLNGLSVLNNSPILSGNSTGNGILGGGILNGSQTGILGGGNRHTNKGGRGHRRHRGRW